MDLRELYRYGLLLVLAIGGLFATVSEFQTQTEFLAVHFLDVGQGDAILIQTPDGYEVLIDGGATSQIIKGLSERQSFFDQRVDVVIATHPDTDHIGGLVDVLGRYEIDLVVQTETESESPAPAAFATALENKNTNVQFAQAGQIIKVGASTTIEVLSPASPTNNWRPNAASIIVRVVYGDTSFMLTGDAPTSVEDYLVEVYGENLRSDVLKLGHHGSRTSTSGLFLDAVQPQYAIVSAGIDNRYGHPDQSVMQQVFARDIVTFHTGVDGTVSFYSDGREVWNIKN